MPIEDEIVVLRVQPVISVGPPRVEFQREWDAVPLSRRSPMQHHIWPKACFEAIYADADAVYFKVETSAGLVAAAAFARQGRLLPRLHLAGAEVICEPVDVLCRDQKAAEALAEMLVNAELPIRFGHFPVESPLLPALVSRARRHGTVLRAPVPGSPVIRLSKGWREPESMLNPRRRSDLRRMRRKAEQSGEVAFQSLAPTAVEAEPALDAAIEVEARNWKARSGTALSQNRQQAAFYRCYCRLAAAEGFLRVCFLRIDGDIIAMQIAVECDGAFWLLKIGYDERFAFCSPGNLLMLESVRHAAGRGLRSFEFLGKAASWTRMWTEEERPNTRLRYYPHNRLGYAALADDAITAASRRARTAIDGLRHDRSGGER